MISGTPGFEVINPILIDNQNYLINRGWIPFEKKTLKKSIFLMKITLLEL